jgi:CRP/FNR family transcriptional activator FtrB
MRENDLPEIRALELFRSMSEESFSQLMQAAYLQTFPAQVQLIVEGDRADFLFILIEGRVELLGSNAGRETTMAIIRPYGTFILAAVLKDVVHLMSARTTEKSRVLMIPAQNVRDILAADEAFACAIVNELAGCYRGVVRDHKNLKLRSSVERLANRVISLHKAQGATGSLVLPYDKRTLASLLNMTPENLSRAFGTLKAYGVHVDNETITLTDLPSLEVLAKPNRLIDERV